MFGCEPYYVQTSPFLQCCPTRESLPLPRRQQGPAHAANGRSRAGATGHGFQYSQVRSKGDNAGWPKQPPSSLLHPFGHIIPLTDICLYVDHPCSDPLYSHSKVVPCFSPVTSVTQCPDSCQVSPWSSVNGQELASWQGRRCGASGVYPAHGSASLDYSAGETRRLLQAEDERNEGGKGEERRRIL